MVHLSHRDFSHVGDWTILPLIPQLYHLHRTNSSWMFFVEDRTKINLKVLLETLSNYNETDVSFKFLIETRFTAPQSELKIN